MMTGEQITIDWLKQRLPDIPVQASWPPAGVREFILVEQTGGDISRTVDTIRLTIDVYASSRQEAAILANERVAPILSSLWRHPNVATATVSNIVHIIDPGPPVRQGYTMQLTLTVPGTAQ